jgi:NAD(P)-dependent dehydrogenase (short-subunit alcohol dehydrogenase family)
MRRRTLLATAAAASTAALAGPAIAQGIRERTLRFVPQANLTSLDPIWTTAAVTENHGWTVFDTLYGMTDDLKVQPQMAEGHEVSDDGRSWRIRLREGLRFHDGAPVRAQDCAASLARWSKRDTFGQSLGAVVDAWEAADDRTIRIRLKSPFPLLLDALAKPAAVVPFMMSKRRGSIINLSSVSGEKGGRGQANYAASKGAINGFTRSLACEVAPRNIRVNAVAPGVIDTPFHERYSTQAQLDAMRATIPQGRLATAEECVGAYLFLASASLSPYIIGQVIEVNGGQLMP